MTGILFKWLVPGALTVAAGVGLALALTGPAVTSDLFIRSTAALQSTDADWASVSIDGRDAFVTGTAANRSMVAAVEARLAAVRGVRAVRSDVVLADYVHPFPFSATLRNGQVVLAGGYPDEAVHARLVAAVDPVADETRLYSGAPRAFEAGASFGLQALADLDDGQISLSGTELSIFGRARSPVAFDGLSTIETAVPEGITLVALDVTPPLASPYVWTARFDGKAVTIAGNAPDDQLAETLRAAAPAGIPVSTALQLASGEPAGFSANALSLLKTLLTLESGEATISGDSVTLVGAPADVAIAAAASATVSALGGTATLEPVRAALASPYVWSATKSETGAVTIAGYAPDADTQTLLAGQVAALAADTSVVAAGAPKNFGASARKGLEILALLDSGSVTYESGAWAIAGTVSTPQQGFAADAAYSVAGLRTAGWAYEVHLAKAAAAAPLPNVAPFVWHAVKTADGKVAFSGFAPSEAFRDFVRVRVPRATDETSLAAGAPASFGTSAAAGLEALEALESGSLSLNGERWSLTGTAASDAARDAIAHALAAKTDAANWQVTLESLTPALPVMSPYLWAADKTSTGEVSLSGYLPTADLEAGIKAKAGNIARENLSIAAGEPAGFAEDLMAGLDALGHLQFGRVAFDGQGWTLAGEAASDAGRDAALAALSRDGKLAANWTLSVSVSASAVPATEAAPPPVAGPAPESVAPAAPLAEAAPPRPETMPETLVFSAERSAAGQTSLAGSVPADATAAYFGVIAGNAPIDGLKVAAGLPEDFIVSGTAGLEALAELSEGHLGFDGQHWWLSGKAEQQQRRAAALATIAALPAGEAWGVSIELLAPLDVCRGRVAELAGRNAILFETGKSVLTESSLTVLDELAADLAICPQTSVHVQGHTDSDGDAASNLALSVSRAEAVVAELARRGVAEDRLYAEGFGASDPIVANDNKDNKARNRRITFAVTPR